MSADRFATVTAIFPDQAHADLATRTVAAEGLPPAQVSVLRADLDQQQIGAASGEGSEVDEGGPAAAAVIGGGTGAALLGSLTAAGMLASGVGLLAVGPLLASVAGAGVGGAAGGILGSIFGSAVAEDTSTAYEQALEEGRVVVAFTGSGGEVEAVQRIFERAGGKDIVRGLS